MINKENIGTTKTINKCVKMATGKYLLFFASDDILYDKHVISNFVKTFEENNYYIVTSQCHMYDNKMKKKEFNYISDYYAARLNNYSTEEMFNELCKSCLFASGATAYKTSIFKKIGYFDEGYSGEVHIHLINHGSDAVIIKPGMKVIQFLLLEVGKQVVIEIGNAEYEERMEQYTRGANGFGSTGV